MVHQLTPDAATDNSPGVALLVDRDPDTRRLYSDCLRFEQYAVDFSSDGREALAKAITRPPNLIVTETQILGIDGYSLVELLRRDNQTSRVPIIVVIGDDAPHGVDRAKNAGADAVVVKPCVRETVLEAIRQAQQHSRQLRARSELVRATAEKQLLKSTQLAARSQRLIALFRRYATHTPPRPPLPLTCPVCDELLLYEVSHVGGVNEKQKEQWDDFSCPKGCGAFQYRHRTRKLSKRMA